MTVLFPAQAITIYANSINHPPRGGANKNIMKVEKETQLKIKIKGEDINNLKTAIDKVITESKQVGFKRNLFSDDERKVLTKLSDSLK